MASNSRTCRDRARRGDASSGRSARRALRRSHSTTGSDRSSATCRRGMRSRRRGAALRYRTSAHEPGCHAAPTRCTRCTRLAVGPGGLGGRGDSRMLRAPCRRARRRRRDRGPRGSCGRTRGRSPPDHRWMGGRRSARPSNTRGRHGGRGARPQSEASPSTRASRRAGPGSLVWIQTGETRRGNGSRRGARAASRSLLSDPVGGR